MDFFDFLTATGKGNRIRYLIAAPVSLTKAFLPAGSKTCLKLFQCKTWGEDTCWTMATMLSPAVPACEVRCDHRTAAHVGGIVLFSLFKDWGRLNCLCPVWVFAVSSSWVLQELGSAAHGFRSHCKPRAHRRAQSKVNLGSVLVYLAVRELSPVRECWTGNQRVTTEPNSGPVFSSN